MISWLLFPFLVLKGCADVLNLPLQAFPRRVKGGRRGRGPTSMRASLEGILRQHLPQLGPQLSRHSSVTLRQMHPNKSVHSKKGLRSSKSSETRSGLEDRREPCWREQEEQSLGQTWVLVLCREPKRPLPSGGSSCTFPQGTLPLSSPLSDF